MHNPGAYYVYLALDALDSFAGAIVNSIHYPIHNTWLLRQIEPQVRATVLSIRGLSDAFGQTMGGPLVGLIGSALSVRAAIVISGLLKIPNVGLFVRVLHRDKARAAVAYDGVSAI